MDLNQPLLPDNFPLDLGGPFTRAMARSAGINDDHLSHLVREGFLRRPIKGVYVATQLRDSLELRASMLQLVIPRDCFVTDRTAGWLHGCPMILSASDQLGVPTVSMFRPSDRGRLRNRLSVSGERSVGADDLQEVHGLLVTTPLRTALDLGRLERRTQALECIDQLLGLGRFTRDELVAEVPRFKGARGVVQLRELAPIADGRAQSPGESALRLDWLDAGLPRPELQVPIEQDGAVLFWLDIGLPELLFAAEYDGVEWHTSVHDAAYDEARRGWISRNRAYQIEVFRREGVYGPRANALGRLAAAYREARRTLGSRLSRRSGRDELAPTRRHPRTN